MADNATFPEPSKDTALAVTSPLMLTFLAVAKAVAVVAFPVKAASTVQATNVSEPIDHLSKVVVLIVVVVPLINKLP